MEHAPLLIEIGLEELPAIPFLKELPNIRTKWNALLEENTLTCECTFHYTPRRMVFWHPAFPCKQPDSEEELYGPPADVAFKDGIPTKAAEGFARKCGVGLDDLEQVDKDGRTVLYFKRSKQGLPSEELLSWMIPALLKKLHFGKAMRWGSREDDFIRPIRWLNCMMADKAVTCETYGVSSTLQTFGHRTLSYDPIPVTDAGSFASLLEQHGVILDQEIRKERILTQISALEKSHGIKVELDEELLAEIVAITEYPTALLGSFEEKFLELPDEVIITSMKEHQRYFAVYKEGTLANHFVVVSNARTDSFGKVLSGNEKVLRARLSDALFFWHNDLKNGLHSEGLKNIVFTEGLGTLFEKVERERELSLILFEQFKAELMEKTQMQEGELKALLERAVMLGKADLLTEMVYEFTELQGIMGYHYATRLNEHSFVAEAIKEQYLPAGEESALPSSLFSAIIATAHKLDNLMALFSVDRIPTGSKDPFALRRAAQGILQIILDQKLPFDLSKILTQARSYYKSFDVKPLEEFFAERFYNLHDCNPSIIKSVLQSGEQNILELSRKIDAMAEITSKEDFKERFATFKRVANITKDIDVSKPLDIDSSLFEEDAEKALHKAFENAQQSADSATDYKEKLEILFALKPELDSFFDGVMVNAEDEKIRTNRKNLVASIYHSFLAIADLKEISI